MILPRLASGHNSSRASKLHTLVKETANRYCACSFESALFNQDTRVQPPYIAAYSSYLHFTTSERSYTHIDPCAYTRLPGHQLPQVTADCTDRTPRQRQPGRSTLLGLTLAQHTEFRPRRPYSLLAPASSFEMAGTRNYDFLVRRL